jgi:hypothetical protein
MTSGEEFVEFAVAASPRLRGMAFLPCGDWHTAEDLVQTALAKVFVSWRKVRRQDAAHAYAARTLINTYLAEKRLKRAGEVLTDQLPEHPAEPLAPAITITPDGKTAYVTGSPLSGAVTVTSIATAANTQGSWSKSANCTPRAAARVPPIPADPAAVHVVVQHGRLAPRADQPSAQ